MKSYHHFNFPRASVIHFRASLYVMRLNLTSVLKVMTIWISQELPLFNSERLDMWFAWIENPCEKLWPFEFLKSFRCSILSLLTSYAIESDIRVKSYDHLNFSRASVVQFPASRHIMRRIGHSCEKSLSFDILESFRCLISCVSIYYKPESDIRVKCYDHFNFSRASVVQIRASRHLMGSNRTSVWKVMTIWISREFPMFNFERIDIL